MEDLIWGVFWVVQLRGALQLAFADRQGGVKTDDNVKRGFDLIILRFDLTKPITKATI
jgi:hypothetical protein